MRHPLRAALAVAASITLLSCSDASEPMGATETAVGVTWQPSSVMPAVRFSEIHYDNTGTDTGEAIEVSAPAGTDLTGWSVVLYNGNGGAVYGTRALSGTVADICGGRGVTVLTYPSNGIQNGNPDGMALVDPSGTVIEFLSYGGVFTGVGGAADGMLSVDIGVMESSATAIGESLQRTGSDTWTGPTASTFGTCNDENEAPPPPPPPPPPPASTTFISEIHYDNSGTDTGEAIEVEGPAGKDLTGWTVVLYNGNGGAPYNTSTLGVTIPDVCSGRGVVVLTYPSNGIQNGNPDGIALVDDAGVVVEFISYGGVFTGVGGPANGMLSVDIGVTESSATPIGQSLQRTAGTWEAPKTSSFGVCNGGTTPPPPPPQQISFSGRAASDPPLPVGFEDQLFATLTAGGVAVPTTWTWASETPGLASVDANGVVRALGVGTAVIRATAMDGTTATYGVPTRVAAASTTAAYQNNSEFGEPVDGNPADDIIIRRAQFTTSFSATRNTPNWVTYNIDATHFGPEDRCDCFTADPQLPTGVGAITTADYTGAGAVAGFGIDRGHMVRSFDRTAGSLDNAVTYYFSNIVPQTADNNQGPWAAFEQHIGDMARLQNREVFVIAGVAGNAGTVKNEGRIVIPSMVWKVALVLPRDAGIGSIDSFDDVQVLAVIMPNVPGIRNVPWSSFVTTVDAIETASGYDLLALLPDHIEIALESGTVPPVAATDGPYSGAEERPIVMSAAASSDADGQPLTYAWSFGDGTTDAGVNVAHTYMTSGTYQVRLIVTDVLGLADTTTTSAAVRALTLAERLDALTAGVTAAVSTGAVSQGNGTALLATLAAAASQIERGNNVAAYNQLGAFMEQVRALQDAGRITARDAADWLAAAGRARARMQ